MKNVPKLRFKEFSDEWEEKQLGDFAEKITSKNKGFVVNNVISNSAKNGLISQRDFFDKEIANKDNIDGYYIIENGDFVYNPRRSNEAPYGPINMFNQEEAGVVSPLYFCFRVNKINNKYLQWYFKSAKWYKYIHMNSDQGARHDRVSIKDSEVLKMAIKVPNMVEQEKIANFLTKVDKLIEKQDEKVNNLEQYKKGMMQKIFSQEIRFKKDDGGEYPEWEYKKLGGLGVFYRGHSYNKNDVSEKGLLVLRSNNIRDNKLNYEDIQFVTKQCKDDIKLKDKDLIICMANGSKKLVGKSGEYKENLAYPDITVGAFCSIYRSNNIITKYLFQTSQYQEYLSTLLAGTNINNLKNSDLEELEFSIPSSNVEQIKMANFLTKIDLIVEKEKEKLEELREWKKGLLQGLFI